jgi:hypothetical protein
MKNAKNKRNAVTHPFAEQFSDTSNAQNDLIFLSVSPFCVAKRSTQK